LAIEEGRHPHTVHASHPEPKTQEEEDEWSDAMEAIPARQEPPWSGSLQELMGMYNASKAPASGADTRVDTRVYNEDGGVVRVGKGIGGKTYYCGEVKHPSSWFPLDTAHLYPSDKTCGPDNGMQCIACRRVQDEHMIGKTNQGNCHEVFKEAFEEWIASIDEDDTPPGLIPEKIKVCNGRLNTNQGSKTIALTAIEVMGEVCKAARLRYTVEKNMSITLDTCNCDITATNTRTNHTMKVIVRVKTMCQRTDRVDQYDHTHTECMFYRRYVKPS
jgi:hypothetical protein